MSEFYNKTTVESEWGAMFSLAKSHFELNNEKHLKYHQCIVLSFVDGVQIVCPFSADCIDVLKSQACSKVTGLMEKHNKNAIKKVICMWESETIDVPSSEFMKMLCKLNEDNKKALILLNAGTDMYVAKRIEDII